jgi:FMN phosphatase YigB (HAD superfamily)
MNRELPTSIFLDLDDTLYEYLPCHQEGLKAAIRLMSNKLNISNKEAQLIYENGRIQVKARLGNTASSHSRLLYFREGLISNGLGRESILCLDFENRYWTNFLFKMKIKDGVRNLISSLKYANIPIFLVTDLTDQIQLRKIARLKLEDTFDEIISSELSGGDKVTNKPFEILFNSLAPEILNRPIFIGDSIQDFPNLKNFVNYQGSTTEKNFCFSSVGNSHMKIEKVKDFQEIESKIFVANE